MKLSVVIPCFNAGSTIALQLQALAAQVWSQPWEVVIADNGSTDNTLAIARQFQDALPALQIVDASDRPGAPHARNVGVRASQGELLAFCDADDEVAPGWVAAMGTALAEQDLVAGCVEYHRLNPPWLVAAHANQANQTNQAIEYLEPPYLPYAMGCNLGLRRSLYNSLGGLDESVQYAWDTEFCWRAQKVVGLRLHFAADAIVHYRLRHEAIHRYRQGCNWGADHVLLQQRYGQPLHALMPGRYAIQLLRHLLGFWASQGSLAQQAEWIWQLGWRMGKLQGSLKYGYSPLPIEQVTPPSVSVLEPMLDLPTN